MRITESRLRSLIRSVIIESSKPVLKKEEEVVDAFESVVNSDLENIINRAVEKKEKGKISSIAMVLGKKLRVAYRANYSIELKPKEFTRAVNKGLNKYISDKNVKRAEDL